MPRRSEMSAEALLGLFKTAGLLKGLPRRGWAVKLGMKEPESVADHTFRAAVMAMVYSDLRGLDTGKVLKMALMHDLPESLVGDHIPGEISREKKFDLESAAMKRILEGLPPKQARGYLDIWLEFNEGRSAEARLVVQVDKLEMGVQAIEYRMAGMGERTGEFVRSARSGIEDREFLALLSLLSSQS